MDIAKLILSGSRSIWGIITPNVRKVSVNQIEKVIYIHFYYNDVPSEMEIELSEEAASEFIADFSEPFLIKCERHVIGYPKKIHFDGYLVYSRYENIPNQPNLED